MKPVAVMGVLQRIIFGRIKMFRRIFNKKKREPVPSIPPIEKIAEELYNKSLPICGYEVVRVIHNRDNTKRFILLKSEDGFYKYTYEEIEVLDEDEWMLCCNIPDAYPAYWLPKDKTFAYSFFGTENEAIISLKQETEYLQYFN